MLGSTWRPISLAGAVRGVGALAHEAECGPTGEVPNTLARVGSGFGRSGCAGRWTAAVRAIIRARGVRPFEGCERRTHAESEPRV